MPNLRAALNTIEQPFEESPEREDILTILCRMDFSKELREKDIKQLLTVHKWVLEIEKRTKEELILMGLA